MIIQDFILYFELLLFKKCCNRIGTFHAADWLIMALTLRFGTHIQTPNTLMHRNDCKSSCYMDQVNIDNNNLVTRFFPVLPMTLVLMTRLSFKYAIMLILPLLRLNINMHAEYVRQQHGMNHYLRFFKFRNK